MKFNEAIEQILEGGDPNIAYLQTLNKSSNIEILDMDEIEDLDEVEITIKKFPMKSIDNYDGEIDAEEALESDIEENYDGLAFEGMSNKQVDLSYYFDDGVESLKRFLKDYKVKI